MNLVLMGLRGSGKTTLGERVAAAHGLRFIDLDQRTASLFGLRSTAEAWRKHGEPAFREAEITALKQAIAEDPEILALGGGTPTAPGGAELVRSLKAPAGVPWSRVVYLRAEAAVLARRLRAGGVGDRPSLTGADPIAEIESVLSARDPLYLELADEVIEVGDLDADEAVQALGKILAWD